MNNESDNQPLVDADELKRLINLPFNLLKACVDFKKLATINTVGHSNALMYAAAYGNMNIISEIIDYSPFEQINIENHTALYYAISNFRFDIYKLFLGKIKDINSTNVGIEDYGSLLNYMLSRRQSETIMVMIRELLTKNPDPNTPTKVSGKTALMFAAEDEKLSDIILDLINAGADIYAKDKNGKNSLDYATTKNRGIITTYIMNKTNEGCNIMENILKMDSSQKTKINNIITNPNNYIILETTNDPKKMELINSFIKAINDGEAQQPAPTDLGDTHVTDAQPNMDPPNNL